MEKISFFILDVFAQKKFSGNQLGVIPDAKNIRPELMQKIARELNFSETTFITSINKKDNVYKVRIFTPNEEVPFAGHPSLGTSYVIQKYIIKKNITQIKLDLKAGIIPVSFDYKSNTIWMSQNQPFFSEKYKSSDLAKILNINKSDIDKKHPIENVSTGLPFVIVPLKNLNAVKRCRINLDLYNRFINKYSVKTVFVFSPETYDKKNALNARMFVPAFGITEDPATGSAAGCLAGYLLKNNYFNNNKINITIEQGFEIGRESILYINAEKAADKYKINVGGKVFLLAEGNFSI